MAGTAGRRVVIQDADPGDRIDVTTVVPSSGPEYRRGPSLLTGQAYTST